MIDFSTVFTWLNQFDKSHLNDSALFLVQRFQSAKINGLDADKSAADTEAAGRAARDPLCTAEVLVILADDYYRTGRYNLALRKLNDAVEIYREQVGKSKTNASRHKLGVARLLYGYTAWGLQLHYLAFEAWKHARNDFMALGERSEDEKVGPEKGEKVDNADPKVNWYKTVVGEIEVALALTAEETYTWLYEFPAENMRVRAQKRDKNGDEGASGESDNRSPTMMSEMLVLRRDMIVAEIKKAEHANASSENKNGGDFRVVAQNIQAMLASLEQFHDMAERAEALVECGLALHQIRDNRGAAANLAKAVAYFPPRSHQLAVARWMLGIMQFQPGAGNSDYRSTFRLAREEMDVLLTKANLDNNHELVGWYKGKIEIMDRAVKSLLDRESRLQ